MNQDATHTLYMDLAKRVAQESYCERKQVGAAIVTLSGGIYLGFNGTPSGYRNICEFADGKTDPMVIHAEENALSKMVKEGVSSNGAVLYSTLSPCVECAKMLYSAGIKVVYYSELFFYEEHLDDFIELGMTFYQEQPIVGDKVYWQEKFNI